MTSSRAIPFDSTYQSLDLGNDLSSRFRGDFNQTKRYKRSEKVKGKNEEIIWSAILLTVPLLLLTCVLFAFVFGYRVNIGEAPFDHLKGNESALGDNDAYYVALNATFLIFLASWMSSLAPMLTGVAVTLAAYPIAGRLLEDTIEEKHQTLLTPFQFNLAVRLVDGSAWSGLWNLMLYKIGWGKQTRMRGTALSSLFRLTLFFVVLGSIVFGFDTWLHVVTKTVSIDRLTVVASGDAPYSLSLLSPNCTTTDNSIAELFGANLSCTMDPGTSKLANGVPSIQTLNNQSNSISVFNNGPNNTIAYLGISQSHRNSKHDFTGTTFGIHSQCRPITQECGLVMPAGDNPTSFPFNCNNGGWNSSIQVADINWLYFADANMSTSGAGSVQNPFYYGVAANSQFTSNAVTNIADDPEIQVLADSLNFLLFCTVTMYDIEYDSIQGNITRMVPTVSNSSVANVLVPGLSNTLYGKTSTQTALQMVSIIADNAQAMADQFALEYNKIALSIAAGSVVQTAPTAVQSRDSILVAKVPKAPMFLLVAINFVFIVAGALLGFFALRSSSEAHEAQARFSIAGLVANLFEGDIARNPGYAVERLYGEYWDGGQTTNRVGIARTSPGGYVLRASDKELDALGNAERAQRVL